MENVRWADLPTELIVFIWSLESCKKAARCPIDAQILVEILAGDWAQFRAFASEASYEVRMQASSRRESSSVLISMNRGDTENGFVWLERAMEDRSTQLVFLAVDPMFDAFRADPRFVHPFSELGFIV